MRPVKNWKAVLRRAWSIRLAVLAGAFSAAEVALPILDGLLPIPRGAFAAISALAAFGAFVARFIAQKDIVDE